MILDLTFDIPPCWTLSKLPDMDISLALYGLLDISVLNLLRAMLGNLSWNDMCMKQYNIENVNVLLMTGIANGIANVGTDELSLPISSFTSIHQYIICFELKNRNWTQMLVVITVNLSSLVYSKIFLLQLYKIKTTWDSKEISNRSVTLY